MKAAARPRPCRRSATRFPRSILPRRPPWCANWWRRCWKRRSRTTSATGPWEIEWIALPEIFMLSAGALAQTRFLVSGLQVNEKKMRENLDITKGLIMSEAVMMWLGAAMGRNRAHDVVYDICREVVKTGRPLVDLLAENKEISKHASRKQLQKLVDPANYLGVAGEMVDRVLKMRKKR